ncbi:replication-associated protein [Gompholobium virus A]|nr:replication-associated protein [Gompholobium virus A]ANY30823.1 replication-associated protein [Gompholobium virus A]
MEFGFGSRLKHVAGTFVKTGVKLTVGSCLLGGSLVALSGSLYLRAAYEGYSVLESAAHLAVEHIHMPRVVSTLGFEEPECEPSHLEDGKDYPEDKDICDFLETTHVEVPQEPNAEKKKYRQISTIKRRLKKPFVHTLVANAKCHFGGTPSYRDSNILAVNKYMVAKCLDHHMTISQVRQVVADAAPLVFLPDEGDINFKKTLNSHLAYMQRSRLELASRVDHWFVQVLSNPLDSRAWRRMWMVLRGLPPHEAISTIK